MSKHKRAAAHVAPVRMWDYQLPVSRLLTLGDPFGLQGETNFAALGLSQRDIPEIMRLATDARLLDNDTATADVWGPIHAWRALGQLHAAEAVEPLLGLLHRIDDNDDDWVSEELLDVIPQIGAQCVPAVAAYLADPTHGPFARMTAAEILRKTAERYPDKRAECVAILSKQLESFATTNNDVNAMVIWQLVDLKATEAVPVMEQAFAADAVSKEMVGDWEEVQIALGLKQERDTPQPHYLAEKMGIDPVKLGLARGGRFFRGLGKRHTDPWQAEKRKHKKH